MEANELSARHPRNLARIRSPLEASRPRPRPRRRRQSRSDPRRDGSVQIRDPTARILRARIIALQAAIWIGPRNSLTGRGAARPPASARPRRAMLAGIPGCSRFWPPVAILPPSPGPGGISDARPGGGAPQGLPISFAAGAVPGHARSVRSREQDYTRLTEFPDRVPRGHELLGVFYGVRNAIDKALATWEAGLKAAPDDVQLRGFWSASCWSSPRRSTNSVAWRCWMSRWPATPTIPTGVPYATALTSSGERAAQATDLAVGRP